MRTGSRGRRTSDESAEAAFERDALARWESEGGALGEVRPDKVQAPNNFLKRGKEAAADLATASKRQVHRTRIELEVRRLESKINSRIGALGHELFALLEAGVLQVDVPGVRERMKAIAELQGELARKRARLKDVRKTGSAERVIRDSMTNIDANAMREASSSQSAKDAAADAAGNPAEQGGQG